MNITDIPSLEKSEIEKFPFKRAPWKVFNVKPELWRYDEYAVASTIFDSVEGVCKDYDSNVLYILCNVAGEKFYVKTSFKYFDALNRHKDHIRERINLGVSFRDAWNVDNWLAESCSNIISMLEANTHSYPGERVEDYHKKVLSIEEKPFEISEEESKMSVEDRQDKWYHDDLKRMIFLFNQYDESKCAEKNQYNYETEFKAYAQRQTEIDNYRIKCLHNAISIMNIYIVDLWD